MYNPHLNGSISVLRFFRFRDERFFLHSATAIPTKSARKNRATINPEWSTSAGRSTRYCATTKRRKARKREGEGRERAVGKREREEKESRELIPGCIETPLLLRFADKLHGLNTARSAVGTWRLEEGERGERERERADRVNGKKIGVHEIYSAANGAFWMYRGWIASKSWKKRFIEWLISERNPRRYFSGLFCGCLSERESIAHN